MPSISPTHAAQAIAARYLRAWTDSLPDTRCLYIDGFPDDGMLARVAALPPGAAAILVEEDPARVARLRESLGPLDRPNLMVLESDMAGAAPALAERASGVEHTLVHLHPPTPWTLPLDVVRVLAALPGVDLWIRFPHEELHKLARFRGSTLADLPPYARRIVDGYSRLLEDLRQGWAAEWRRLAMAALPAAAEQMVVERYRDKLLGVGSGQVLKLAVLGLDEGASLYLFCMTGDPLRALALNEVLGELALDEQVHWPAERFRHTRVAAPPVAETLDFFSGVRPPASTIPQRELDENALADALGSRFVGRTVPLGDVAREMVSTDVFADDIRRALRLLRRDGRALYRSLKTADAEIAFPALPLAPRGPTRRVAPDTLELLPQCPRPE
ncbi:hypothetical protein BH20GEM3_BH20GEM3_15510 [soil metagenome]